MAGQPPALRDPWAAAPRAPRYSPSRWALSPHPLYKRNWRRRARTRTRASVPKPVLFHWHCCHTSAPRPCPAPARPHREQKERPSCRPASSQWSQEGCRPPTELCLHISDPVSLGNTSLRVPGAVPSSEAPHEWTARRTQTRAGSGFRLGSNTYPAGTGGPGTPAGRWEGS